MSGRLYSMPVSPVPHLLARSTILTPRCKGSANTHSISRTMGQPTCNE